MKLTLLLLSALCFSCFATTANSAEIFGSVTDSAGRPVPFASITVKGSSKGVIANSRGTYVLELAPGNYDILCEHIGFRRQVKSVNVAAARVQVNFTLLVQELVMEEIVIKRGKDPAIEIIRNTIKKREFYHKQVDSFSVDVYIKGVLKSRRIPERVMGKKVTREDFEGEEIDSAGKGILFLSESVTKVNFASPDKMKLEVISSRESGGGYGLSFPFFINFYANNVSLFSNNINPRGFLSPICDNAFHYYDFKFEGSFFENDRMIDRIRVKPKRQNEPLFDGFLQIVDGEWRLHSLDLTTTKKNQLELLDTLRVSQQHSLIEGDVWRVSSQVVYLNLQQFGFDIVGDFLNVYSHYDLTPGFTKKSFGNVVMSYDSTANKKDSAYWTQARPVALESDESRNFYFKDSVSKSWTDSFSKRNFDSIRKVRRPITAKELLWTGYQRSSYKPRYSLTYRLAPLIKQLEYNTVEGLSINLEQGFDYRRFKGKRTYSLDLFSRYGLSNSHFNMFGNLRITPYRSEDYRNRYLRLAGGKRVSQFNKDNPIDPLTNELYTLLIKRNYIKLYENWFGEIEYNSKSQHGLLVNVLLNYENRLPLENTTDFTVGKTNRQILPNHPYELSYLPFNNHQAFVSRIVLAYQPGQKYIQYPRRKVPIGSKYPTFELQYTKGWHNIASSDVDYDKWRFSVYDNMNFKIAGELRYRLSIGGFLNDNRVEIPDLQHFNGNQTIFNFKYLNSFQLAPYYRYSNSEPFYTLLHLEHHFNGLFTNKIPLFNRLKWYLVGGTNTFYVNRNNYYVEAFAGLENIFKVFRVDFVTAYQSAPGNSFGVRVGFGGILGNNIRVSR